MKLCWDYNLLCWLGVWTTLEVDKKKKMCIKWTDTRYCLCVIHCCSSIYLSLSLLTLCSVSEVLFLHGKPSRWPDFGMMLLWLCNPDHLVVLEHVVSNLLLMYLMRWSKFAYGMVCFFPSINDEFWFATKWDFLCGSSISLCVCQAYRFAVLIVWSNVTWMRTCS